MRYIVALVMCMFIYSSCGRKSARGNFRTVTNTVIGATKAHRIKTDIDRKYLKPMIASEIFSKCNTAVFMVYTSDGISSSQGSGFFINSSGIGVSNYHVFINKCLGEGQIKLTNGNIYRIQEVLAKSEESDYIIFQIETNEDMFNFIPVSTRPSKIGDKVYAIGSPRGLEYTFSSGEISQYRDGNTIQISTPIDHGSSGGALINSYGEVIGITTSMLNDSGANLNFAIDINVIKRYLPNLR